MANSQVYTMPVGQLGANCHFLINDDTKEVICIDAGDDGARIIDTIKKNNWKLQGILLTHGHVDHISAIGDIKAEWSDVKVYAGKQEVSLLKEPHLNLSTMFGKMVSFEPDEIVSHNEVLQLAGLSIVCLETSGHTQGGICYYLEKEKMVFTGDTLFYRSIGRTDFPTGNYEELEHSIQDILYQLPEDTVVYAGHGRQTTIGFEKQHNDYVRSHS